MKSFEAKQANHLPLDGVATGEAVSNALLFSALSLSSLVAKSLLHSAEATGGMRHAVTNWSLGRSLSAPCDYSGQSSLRMVKTERLKEHQQRARVYQVLSRKSSLPARACRSIRKGRTCAARAHQMWLLGVATTRCGY